MRIGSIYIPDREFDFQFVRSPGAGGQNVNKINSKAVLRWNVINTPSLSEAARQRFLARWAKRVASNGDVVITSSRFRDQLRNKQDVLEKLVKLIEAIASPPKKRKKTKPTKASKERRLREKKQRSEIKSRRQTKAYE
ncbi:MAG: aminoacyl-tRNA hydrolase [Deltaproteobacteria bacterium]|nr:aminoacyl-tRNA hydrolase [Deltaproteobacteria bacterium]